MAGVDFRVLGDVQILVDRSPRHLRPMERTVLAVMLAEQNRVLTSDQLVERVWQGRPPRTARTALRVHIERLREAMRSHDVARLISVDRGYRLVVERGELDADRFESAVIASRSTTDPEEVLQTLRTALSEWSGPPFADLDLQGLDTYRAVLQRYLSELRVTLARAELALGRHHAVLPDLSRWCSESPYDEALAHSLATAMFRSDDQLGALDACRLFRRRLSDDLGLEPTSAFGDLETAILNRSLVAPRPPSMSLARPRVFRLRGRTRPLSALVDLIEPPTSNVGVIMVTGPAGIGKSEVLAELSRVIPRSLLLHGGGGAGPMRAVTELESHLGLRPTEDSLATTGSLIARAEHILAAMTEHGWTTLLLDDITAMGDDEVTLLRALCHRKPVGVAVVAASRGLSGAENPLLIDSELLHRSTSVRLGPFTVEESAEVARLLISSSRASDDETIRVVVGMASGDPLLVNALCRQVSAGGPVDEVPETVVEFVRRILEVLPEEHAMILRGASLDTEDAIDLALASEAVGLPFSTAVTAAEAGMAHGLLVERDSGLGFRHTLYRDALVESIGAVRRTELHGRIAAVTAAHPVVVNGRVAFHLRAAGPGHRAEAAAWTAREAHDLLRAGAAISAAALFARARELGLAAGTSPATVLDWSLMECETRSRAGQLTEALELAAATSREARRLGLDLVFARAATACAGPLLPNGRSRENAALLTAEGLGLIDADGSYERVALIEAWVRSHVLEDQQVEASRLHEVRTELKDVAFRPGPEATQVRALALRALYNLTWREPVGWADRLSLSEELERLTRRIRGAPMIRLEALRMRACDFIEAGGATGLARTLSTYRREAHELGSPLHQWWSLTMSSTMAGLLGDDAQEQAWTEAAETWREAISPDTVLIATMERTFADALRRDDFSAFSGQLSLAELGELEQEPLLGLAVLLLDQRVGAEVSVTAVRSSWESLRRGPYATAAAALGALTLSGSMDADEGRELGYEFLDRLRACGGGLVYINGAGCLGPVDLYVEGLLTTLGDTSEGARYRERAAPLVSDLARSWSGWSYALGDLG